MSQGWENLEPAPIEFLHSQLLKFFHEAREEKNKNHGFSDEWELTLTGNEFNNIVARAKVATYKKYEGLGIDKPIEKSKMKVVIPPYSG